MNKVKFKCRNKPGIDKLSFTLSIADQHKMIILNRLTSMVNGNKYNIKVFNDPNSSNRERYNNIYQFEFNGFTTKLLVYPINPAHNFLKVEFNPNKSKKEGVIINGFQIVQPSEKQLEIRLIALGQHLKDATCYLTKRIQDTFQHDVDIKFLVVDSIERERSGKLRVVKRTFI